MKLIVSMKFGSELYGTNHKDSDRDIKGIALPSFEDLVFLRVKEKMFGFKTKKNEEGKKNTSKDIDLEIYSLNHFIDMALVGKTEAIDMLHVPDDKIFVTSEIWKYIRQNRSKFYTKNIETFLDYAIGQCAKYGVKGSRLNDAKAVLDWIDNEIILCGNSEGLKKRLIDCDLYTFPVGEHIQWYRIDSDFNAMDMIEVCNRKIHLNVKLGYAYDMVKKFYDEYGDRAKKAANNEGIDWKAVSHAFRAAHQTKAIFTEGDIIYPLKESKFLLDVKLGKLNYNDVAKQLEELIDEVKILREKSTLPEVADKEFWLDFILNAYKGNVK